MATKKKAVKKTVKKAAAKKTVKKKVAAKKGAAKKAAAKKVTKKAAAKKTATRAATKAATKTAPKAKVAKKLSKKAAAELAALEPQPTKPKPGQSVKVTGWNKVQQAKLLALRDSLVDTMDGVAQSTLRPKGDDSNASAFGMHQADAGSDAYDRDFALGMLSKEQDELYEIDEALERIRTGKYGICEVSGKQIPKPRLDALPFARFTVECQEQFERDQAGRNSGGARSVYGLGN